MAIYLGVDMQFLKEFTFAIFSPTFWIVDGQFSRDYDNWLLDQIKTGKFAEMGTHTAKIGGVTLWVANHPFSSFGVYKYGDSPILKSLRCSRLTKMLAYRKLIKDALNQQNQD